ncbi:MAG: hypothetical protein RIB32_03265 [Phycisphaerales bacterium]
MPTWTMMLFAAVGALLILVALRQAFDRPWTTDSGVPLASRYIVPLVLAALAVGVLAWVVIVRL